MALKRKDGKELTKKDKLLYYGILHSFFTTKKGSCIPNNYRKAWVKEVRKLKKEETSEIVDILSLIFERHFERFNNVAFELVVLLDYIVKIDIPVLNELGFDTKSFLNLKFMGEVHPSIKAQKISLEIIDFVKEELDKIGLVVKTILPSRFEKVRDMVISKTDTAFINFTVFHGSKRFISTIYDKDIYLAYFDRALVYMKLKEDGFYVNEKDVLGAGGTIVSNLLILENRDSFTSVGLKHMDDKVYIFTTTYGSIEIEESLLNIKKGYRYTLYKDKHDRISILTWSSKSSRYEDLYRIDEVDLYTEKPIDVIPTKELPTFISDKTIRKAGLKNIDYTKSLIDGDISVLVKENSNAICMRSDKKINVFQDVNFILNEADEEIETKELFYEKLKMLI